METAAFFFVTLILPAMAGIVVFKLQTKGH
jgi:hypothetical protein